MPKRVQLPDGSIGEFPDTMSDSDIEGVLQKQFPAPAVPQKLSFLQKAESKVAPLVQRYEKAVEPITRIEAPDPKNRGKLSGEEAIRAVGNIGAGGLSTILHPIDTLESIGGMITAPGEMLAGKKFSETVPGQLVESFRKNPYGTVEGAIGSTAAAEAVPKVLGGVKDALTKGATSKVQSLAGTGPRVTRGLVEDVKAGNAAADAHSALQARIETARESALKEGNKKYSAVNSELNPLEANGEAVQGAIADAVETLRGSHTEPTLIKGIVSKLERGDSWTYEDLQGDYSRLGRELSKGTLPGDEFKAYDRLHEAFGDEMQRIADSQGKGGELKAARDYWRRMKQTFGKPYSANDAASSVLRAASPELAERAALANRVRLLESFDPQIGTDYQNLVKATEKAKGKSTTVPGETRKISPEDVQARKKQAAIISKVPGIVRSSGYRLGLFWPAIDAIRAVIYGHSPSVSGMLGGATGIVGGAHVIAGLLENPKVVEFLTKATPADVAQIPSELRGNISQIVDAASQKGIDVSPAFGAAMHDAGKNVGSALRGLYKDQGGYLEMPNKLADYLGRRATEIQREGAGRYTLETMEHEGITPQSVSKKFWDKTYYNLPAEGQRYFQRYVSNLWGGAKPGDVIGVTKDGSPIVAKDWMHMAENLGLSNDPSMLEGLERGYVSLMKEANDRFTSKVGNRPESRGTETLPRTAGDILRLK